MLDGLLDGMVAHLWCERPVKSFGSTLEKLLLALEGYWGTFVARFWHNHRDRLIHVKTRKTMNRLNSWGDILEYCICYIDLYCLQQLV